MNKRASLRRPVAILTAGIIVALAALGTVAVASSRSHADSANALQYTVSHGTPVSASTMSQRAETALAASGATGQLYELGTRGDHAYYRGTQSDGSPCYAAGGGSDVATVACLYSNEEMPSALVDMSTVVIRRSDAPKMHLDSVEGIAADQVAAVGIERADGALVTTPVSGNSYRFDAEAIPADAVAIVALDASGKILQRKTV
jgi:hypothetical protein